MQAPETTQIGYYVPVTPTDESQADKGINNPIVSCWECDTEWRSYGLSRCPYCARQVGAQRVLNEQETHDLMEAISHLKEEKFDYDTEYETWEFHDLLTQHVPWYDMSSRVLIQACYFALQHKHLHPKVKFAIDFFHVEYAEALDSEMMYNPNEEDDGEDDKYYTYWENSQYDKMMPPW